uniref:Uncharacterized protein n=1 Tax=Anguilla anguilla TaxID=7936 RepID=A0A0E9S0I0_ANGAN
MSLELTCRTPLLHGIDHEHPKVIFCAIFGLLTDLGQIRIRFGFKYFSTFY